MIEAIGLEILVNRGYCLWKLIVAPPCILLAQAMLQL